MPEDKFVMGKKYWMRYGDFEYRGMFLGYEGITECRAAVFETPAGNYVVLKERHITEHNEITF